MEKDQTLGLVFDVQRYSIHDGPGIRSIVFLKGCPLKCRWCSNPESQSGQIELMYSGAKCIRCGKCADICPKHAICFSDSTVAVDRAACDVCGKCADACLVGGWKLAGEWYDQRELLEWLMKDRACYYASEGGITIGGGEPFFQSGFLKPFLTFCRHKDVHTAVETCGFAAPDVFEDTLDVICTLLMDLKHMDSGKHAAWTGVPNKLILDNWRIAVAKKGTRDIVARVPVIPGFNDTEAEMNDIFAFLSGIGIETVNLLQYHKFGEGKYTSVGKTCGMPPDLTPPGDETMELFRLNAAKIGLTAQVGG